MIPINLPTLKSCATCGDVSERNKIVDKLRKRAIGAAVYYHTPVHFMPTTDNLENIVFPKRRGRPRVFSLPIHVGVTSEGISYIEDSIMQLLE